MKENLISFFKLLYRYWMKFAHVLGWINSRIILTLFYFLIFTPLSLGMRLFGKNFLQSSYPNSDSYWESKEKIVDLQRYLKPY